MKNKINCINLDLKLPAMKNQTESTNALKKLTSYIKPENGNHIWQFSRVGGVNRVNLNSGMDLVSLENLDQKLWTALSCPVYGLEIDPKTLELIDTDHDDRIRVPEVIAAVNWITSIINNPDDIILQKKSFPLSAINDQTEEGKILLASAKQILVNLGKPTNTEITAEETSDVKAIFANTKFNGDGIITEESTDNDDLKKLINEIITYLGSETDRNSKQGITSTHIEEFYKSCEDFSAWFSIAENNSEKIFPFKENTADALDAYMAVKSKIDDYFLRTRLSEFDEGSFEVFSLLTAQYESISTKDLSTCFDEIALLPIAKISSDKNLPLNKMINPSWEKALEKLKALVLIPTFSTKETLSIQEWESINEIFTEYNRWISEKAGNNVENLGIKEIREILANNKKQDLFSLIEQDLELENEANNIITVDKMVRFYCDIFTLLKNFVNFNDFYLPESQAIFQAGKLYIDQRCCDLCIKVNSIDRHNLMAASSGICLVYCECNSKTRNESMTIVAALTDGDFDNISVGRNAVFYDRKGVDWDATIVKVIDNPISIRQAFWSPYKKISKFISTQIEKMATSKEKAFHEKATAGVENTSENLNAGITESFKSNTQSQAVVSASNQQPQAFDIARFVGIFAAISLAFGAIGSVIITILTEFFHLLWWQMPIAFFVIILAISLPSMVLAYLKLRKRNLAPVLDANGWAINARLTINIIFGRTLTHLASLPANSKLNLIDPFSKRRNPVISAVLFFVLAIAILFFLLWYFGILK